MIYDLTDRDQYLAMRAEIRRHMLLYGNVYVMPSQILDSVGLIMILEPWSPWAVLR